MELQQSLEAFSAEVDNLKLALTEEKKEKQNLEEQVISHMIF